MIVDQLEHSDIYRPVHPAFAAAFSFLRDFDPRTPPGKVAIDGDLLFAMVQHYESAPAEFKIWEAHRKYIDIQCVFSGREKVFVAAVSSLTVGKHYDEDSDYMSLAGPSAQSVELAARTFAIFFPHDAHKPGCSVSAASSVVKVVVKVHTQA